MNMKKRRLTPLQRSIENAITHEHELKLEDRRNKYAAKRHMKSVKASRKVAS
jgi:hypothetical protein